jgi:hypothetical protein
MEQALQPIRRFILHVRSKDVSREGILNSHLFIQLEQQIDIDPRTEELHQIILSAEIPYSFYNISNALNNDVIKYTISGVAQTFTFESKMYDITEYARVITADTAFPFTATYNSFTMKLTLQNTSANTVTINWTESSAHKPMGFSNLADSDITSGATTSSDNIVDLATVHSIFIKSNTASNMIFSTRAGFSQTIQKISVDRNSGEIIYLNESDYRTTTIINSSVNSLDLRLTEQNNQLLDLNGINYEITIAFFVYPILKRTPVTQIRPTRRTMQPPTAVPVPQLRQPTQAINAPQQAATPNVVRDINNVDEDIQHETDLEHTGKRLIIDELIDKMSKN